MSDKNTTLKDLLRFPVEEQGDNVNYLICFVQEGNEWDRWTSKNIPIRQCTFDELPDIKLDTGYGGTDGPALIAYSPRYVYVYVQYDGSQWIEAVPRHPEFVTGNIPWLGGG